MAFDNRDLLGMTEILQQHGKEDDSSLDFPVRDVPIEHLDFAYVNECTDVKELRAIADMLRSGKEGYFPGLEDSVKSRLLSILPKMERERLRSQLGGPSAAETRGATSDLESWLKTVWDENGNSAGSGNLLNQGPRLPPPRAPLTVSAAVVGAPPVAAPVADGADTPTPKREVKALPIVDQYKKWAAYERVVAKEDDLAAEPPPSSINASVAGKQQSARASTTLTSPQTSPPVPSATAAAPAGARLDELKHEKQRGDDAFRAGKYVEAAACYSHCITLHQLNPKISAFFGEDVQLPPLTASDRDDRGPVAILFANRAQSRLNTGDVEGARADCDSALQFDPGYAKAWVRRAATHTAPTSSTVQSHSAAVADLERALALAKSSVAVDAVPPIQRLLDAARTALAAAVSKANSVAATGGVEAQPVVVPTSSSSAETTVSFAASASKSLRLSVEEVVERTQMTSIEMKGCSVPPIAAAVLPQSSTATSSGTGTNAGAVVSSTSLHSTTSAAAHAVAPTDSVAATAVPLQTTVLPPAAAAVADAIVPAPTASAAPAAAHAPASAPTATTTTPPAVPSAAALKEFGNKLLKEGRLLDAVDAYSRALGEGTAPTTTTAAAVGADAVVPALSIEDRVALLSNRSFVLLKLNKHGDACADCNAALALLGLGSDAALYALGAGTLSSSSGSRKGAPPLALSSSAMSSLAVKVLFRRAAAAKERSAAAASTAAATGDTSDGSAVLTSAIRDLQAAAALEPSNAKVAEMLKGLRAQLTALDKTAAAAPSSPLKLPHVAATANTRSPSLGNPRERAGFVPTPTDGASAPNAPSAPLAAAATAGVDVPASRAATASPSAAASDDLAVRIRTQAAGALQKVRASAGQTSAGTAVHPITAAAAATSLLLLPPDSPIRTLMDLERMCASLRRHPAALFAYLMRNMADRQGPATNAAATSVAGAGLASLVGLKRQIEADTVTAVLAALAEGSAHVQQQEQQRQQQQLSASSDTLPESGPAVAAGGAASPTAAAAAISPVVAAGLIHRVLAGMAASPCFSTTVLMFGKEEKAAIGALATNLRRWREAASCSVQTREHAAAAVAVLAASFD